MPIANESTTNGSSPQTDVVLPQELEIPELPYEQIFYPFGFPLVVKTNSREVLRQYGEMWGLFRQQQDVEPIRAEVWLLDGDANECPPAPSYRLAPPVFIAVADANNYSIVDMERCVGRIVISQAAIARPLYAQYYLLGIAASCVTSRQATFIHAACVELDGKGILLCGDSGTGKSTLAYACARAGWTYVSDDASLLASSSSPHRVTGDCHRIRFRPSAAELFPELQGHEITPRAAGKPSVELPTAPMAGIRCAETAELNHIVFLNRDWNGPAEIFPYSKSAARTYMLQTLFAPREVRLEQHRTIERLLEIEVLELRYRRLDDAIECLRTLIREGK